MNLSLKTAGAAGIIAPAIIVAFVAWLPPSVEAQWPRHTDAGVPRTADGKVNMSAPAPRTPDGKPDLSGVWENLGWREGAAAGGSVSGTGGAPGSRSAESRRPPAPSIAMFFDIGSAIPGGLPFQPWARALKDKRTAENAKDNPDAHCLPLGNMQLHLHPEPRKIIWSPKQIVILYEGNGGVRQIFTDGRALPPRDAQPWWFGYSIGKWAGDTLVVETSRIPRWRVARRQRQPVDGSGKDDRTVPARQRRHAGARAHGRRPESLHPSVDGQSDAAPHAGRRAD